MVTNEDCPFNTTVSFSLASLYTEKGDIDYELVKKLANDILSGQSRIIRLNDGEEQGRLLGGQRNVEASLIAGAEERAGPEGESRGSAIQRSEEALETYARSEGIWFDDLNLNYAQIAEGVEAIVYEDRDDPNFVLKAARFVNSAPLETLDQRISLFNFLFAETAYELKGFTRDAKGLRFVLRQPFIHGNAGHDDHQALTARMRESGLLATPDPRKFTNTNYSVRDVHQHNYIKYDGTVFVIDAMTTLNTPEFGGRREYHPFEVISSTESPLPC